MKKLSILIFTIITFLTPVLFCDASVTGKLLSSSDYITPTSIALIVEIPTGSDFSVQIYKTGTAQPLGYKENSTSVIFNNLTPSTSYTVSLYVKGNEYSLFEYPFTTKDVNAITVNTYDLSSNSVGLEFHNLLVGKKYTAFIKADSENGNTGNFSHTSEITPTTAGVFLKKFDDLLSPKSAYVGGIVDNVSVRFITLTTSDLNFTTLNTTLATANNLYSSATEGTAVGNYAVGSKAILKKAIDDIPYPIEEKVPNITQTEIDNYNSILEEAITTFGTKVVGGTSNPTSDPSTKSGFFGKGGGILPACPENAPCGFNELMKLINNVITFLLFTIATPLAALVIVYAGWLYLSAGGSAENATKAKKILMNVVIGYIIALAAWLIVKTILVSLGFQAGADAQFFDYLK